MPHAFRSAALIEADNARFKLDRLRDRWTATRDTWFDGTPASVDRRIAQCDEVINFAKHIGSRLHASAVGVTCLSLLPQLRSDRHELLAQRDRLAGAWVPEGVDSSHFNRDPRDYASREEWMNASNLGGWIDHTHQEHPQDPRLRDAALDFIEGENTTDRNELVFRAERMVRDKTARWTPEASQEAVRQFGAAVAHYAPSPVRVASAPAFIADFDDVGMFI